MATKDKEAIKAWVSRTHEEWIPKFKEFGTAFARRLIFFGSTNNKEFLGDETGERRWLPITVAESGFVDPEGIKADRDQLWAEGAALFRADGVQWQEAEALARFEHVKYKVADVWTPRIMKWLADPEAMFGGAPMDNAEGVCLGDVMAGALFINPGVNDIGVARRVGRVLRGLGWEPRQIGPERLNRWFAPPLKKEK